MERSFEKNGCPTLLQTRLKTPFLDGWLEVTKGLNAAADRQEVPPATSATTAVGASAAASPPSGAAA